MSSDNIDLASVFINFESGRGSILFIREAVNNVFGRDDLLLDRGHLL